MRHRGPFLLAIAGIAVALAAWPSPVAGQPRRGPHGHGVRTSVYIGYGYWPYYGYYYAPFYDPFFWYPYPYPLAYYAPAYATSGVRLQVTPRDAEVYVDGYRAGVVDDFDGTFQRLNLPPGQHELVLYHPAYRTIRQTVYLTVGSTYRVRHAMEPLPAGEPPEPRPEPPATPATTPSVPPAPGTHPAPGSLPGLPAGAGPATGPESGVVRADQGAFGTLSIRVQPGDAEVLIDGEAWRGPGDLERLVVQVTEGAHRIVIRKPGFDEFSTEVEVRRGETATINVSLLRRDEA
jgi:hypothetical protein